MSQTVPVGEFRRNLSRLLSDVADRRDHVLVTRNGRPAAVLVPIDEYEVLEETAEILSDPETVAAIEAKVRKVVAASSASAYGLAVDFPTTEAHHPYANDTLYGAAKVFLEGLLRSLHAMNGLDYVALRYFNVYGQRMDIHGVYTEVLVRWMERIEAGTPPLILGTGSQTMDFVNIEDVARATLLGAVTDVTDEVFNVASGTETSLLDLAHMLLKVMGREDLDIEFGPERGVNKVPRRLADTSLAKQRLGFEAEIGLEDGLRRLVDWWRAERAVDGAFAAAS